MLMKILSQIFKRLPLIYVKLDDFTRGTVNIKLCRRLPFNYENSNFIHNFNNNKDISMEF